MTLVFKGIQVIGVMVAVLSVLGASMSLVLAHTGASSPVAQTENSTPSLDKLEISSYLADLWVKFINEEYVPKVRDSKYDLFKDEVPSEAGPSLVYVFEHELTGERVSFSAYEKFESESLVNAIAQVIIQRPSYIVPSKFLIVAGGNLVRDGWALYSFSPVDYQRKDDLTIFEPISIVLRQEASGDWVGAVQGTLAYSEMLKQVPESVLTEQSKSDMILLSNRMYEKHDN